MSLACARAAPAAFMQLNIGVRPHRQVVNNHMSDQSKQRWWLEDVTEVAKQYPYTFWLPSDATIAKLAPGNIVKLIFAFDSDDAEMPRAERMWVDIKERSGSSFRGVLDNDPRYMTGISLGDSLEFEPKHIVDSDISDPTSEAFDRYFQKCFVTDRIMKDKVKTGYVYREAPDKEDDSGWRFLAGDESDEYMDDSNNTNYIAIGSVLNLDGTLTELLDEPDGQWAWDSDARAWQRIENGT